MSFLWVIVRPGAAVLVTACALVAFAASVGWSHPEDADESLAFGLLFQMFMAATGYRERAVRGHLDPVLTRGRSRWSVAAAHGCLSMLPGVLVWLLITGIILVLRPDRHPSSLTVPGLAALVYVSCTAWAFALPLTRYASGVVWLVVLVILAAGTQIEALQRAYTTGGAGSGILARTGAALVVPVLLIAKPDVADIGSSALVLLAGAASAVAGIWFVTACDAPLRNSS
jgi:hypothetical protein